jgi:hypothetical protein
VKLYLIQHGEGKSEAEDPERSLTPKVEEEVRRVSTKGPAWSCSVTEPLSAWIVKKAGRPLGSHVGDGLKGYKIIPIDSMAYLFSCHSSVNRL